MDVRYSYTKSTASTRSVLAQRALSCLREAVLAVGTICIGLSVQLAKICLEIGEELR